METRIVDLPENITMSHQGAENDLHIPSLQTSYTQMNVHPNPYGTGPPNAIAMSPPIHIGRPGPQGGPSGGPQGGQGGYNPYLGGSPEEGGRPQYPLPQRDIPMDTTGLVQDKQVVANYIPSDCEVDVDFVKNQERKIRSEKPKKTRLLDSIKMDDLIAKLQIPIILVILYFVFQSPILDSWIVKYMTFITPTDEKGEFTMSGILFKSVLFGSIYMFITQATQYLSEEV